MTDRTAVLLMVLSTPGLVVAQPHASPEAQQHFETATRAFDTGDYDSAVNEFQAAYDLTQHPDVLFNIYSAAERAGQLQRALDALDGYLDRGNVEAARRPALDERAAHLRERIAAAAVMPDPPAVSPVEPVHQPPPSSPGPVTGPSWIGIGTLIGAGALLVNFGLFAALSTIELGSVSQSCGAAAGRFCRPNDVATVNTYSTIADISWIAGATAAVLGLVFLFVLPPERGPAVMPSAWLMPGGGGVAIAGAL